MTDLEMKMIEKQLFKYKFRMSEEDFQDLLQDSFVKYLKYGKNFVKYSIADKVYYLNNIKENESSISDEFNESFYNLSFEEDYSYIDKDIFWNTLYLVGDFNNKQVMCCCLFREGKKYKEISEILNIDIKKIDNFFNRTVKNVIRKNKQIFKEFV